ncbi:hypothetical protein SAQ01S_07130 [Sphingomonas aquatilis NBRC 16722]|uniref:Rho termination factor N-terminal domain-containing protein n=1 Tax=Sphingomonas aquatilis TaxID=93063 RepID=A0AAW3TT49_9SPHN|nr:hypothetical protein [Sphingomonas aquatilis]MBB3876093.1 hypothetical protein [Sphingomonas aquatilis]GEM70947.1 hypothetical protein SAQ01S_07130 [Sphingomonas aquatilis NBRC 16722]
MTVKTYTSPEAVYVDGIYHNANTPFTTAAEPNDNWERVKPVEKAAMEASDKTLNVQPALEDLELPALKALAATKNVPSVVDGKALSKKELITAIKAADEPTL